MRRRQTKRLQGAPAAARSRQHLLCPQLREMGLKRDQIPSPSGVEAAAAAAVAITVPAVRRRRRLTNLKGNKPSGCIPTGAPAL